MQICRYPLIKIIVFLEILLSIMPVRLIVSLFIPHLPPSLPDISHSLPLSLFTGLEIQRGQCAMHLHTIISYQIIANKVTPIQLA